MKNAIDALRGPLGALQRAWSGTVVYTLHSGESATLYDYVRGMRAQDVFAAAMQQDQLSVINAEAFAVAFAPRATPARLDRVNVGGRNWTVEEWRGSPMLAPVFFKLLLRGGLAMTTPLDIFKQVWTTEVISVPYIECVNTPVDTDSLPDEWGGAVIQPQGRTDVTLGSRPWVEEKGTFAIALLTRDHSGPAALDAAVDEIRAVFHGLAQDGLQIESVDGPHDIDPEVDGEWWRLGLTANYTYQTRRGPAGPLPA